VVRESRAAAEQGRWAVNWQPFEALLRDAQQAAAGQQHSAAVRGYAKGLSFLMNELRNQQRKEANDSNIRF
jgi:hypothetical protein